MPSYLIKKQLLFLFFSLTSFLFLFSNPESQEKIVEVVKVVNVEVVVRVYQDGNPQPLGGLQKNDFKLTANGKEKEIHGFFVERKKIPTGPLKKALKENLPPLSPNLFALIFNIHTCTAQMKESLEIIFDKIIRPNDRVIVFTNQALMNETVVGDTQKMKTRIWEMLQTQSNEMKKKIKQMEREINELADECELVPGDEGLSYYRKDRYNRIKNDFLQSYFNPGAKEYKAIAEYLREKKNNKWILNFYQLGVFPSQSGYTGEIEDYNNNPLYKSISKSFINSGATVYTLLMMTPHVGGNLPEGYEYQYITTQSEIILRDITEQTGGRVIQTTDIDKFVAKITKVEDVYYVLTFDPGNEEIHKINVQMTDANNNYRLVYDNALRSNDFIKNNLQPADLNAIFYDNLGMDLAKEGRFEEAINYFSKAIQFDPENEHLYFNRGLTYFKMKQTDNALTDYTAALNLVPKYFEALYNRGLLFMEKEKFAEAAADFTQAIELKVNHGYSRFYRAMALEKEGNIQPALQDYKSIKEADPAFYLTHSTEIENKIQELQNIDSAEKHLASTIEDYESLLRSLNYKWNLKDSQERLRLIEEKARLPKSPQQLSEQTRLEQILKKCADYCSKLEEAVFHFYCREEVSERLFFISRLSHVQKPGEMLRKFVYEYQVIRDDKQITENRKPLRIDNLPFLNSRSHQKPIAFHHQLLIYGPILLLGGNRQPLYKYRILKEELIEGEKIIVIEALPLYFQEPVPQFGNVSIKASDGSIVGIDWNPKSIRNFQEILDQASHKNTFQIAFNMELNVVKNNLHFPSKCRVKWINKEVDNEIRAAARKKGHVLTGAITDIIYKNYKFFTVGTEILKEEFDINGAAKIDNAGK